MVSVSTDQGGMCRRQRDLSGGADLREGGLGRRGKNKREKGLIMRVMGITQPADVWT